MFRFICILFFFLGVQILGFAQNKLAESEKLALQYFENREFDKANIYFEELYDYNPGTWFPQYYKSLLGAGDLDRAEKVTRKQLKINRYNVHYYIYLGRINALRNEPRREKECYDRALKELLIQQPYIYNLATTFVEEKKIRLCSAGV